MIILGVRSTPQPEAEFPGGAQELPRFNRASLENAFISYKISAVFGKGYILQCCCPL